MNKKRRQKNNGVDYKFSAEEVGAVGELIRWAQEYKGKEARDTVKIVATAFNGPVFKMMSGESVCQKDEKCGIINKNNNMQMQKGKPSQKEIELATKRFTKYNKENEALLKKHKLKSRVVISWPNKMKPPRIGKFAMWLLNKTGAIVDTEFKII